MSFLSGLFKKKPGGSFFGNLLRGAVKQIPIVGGALGNGGNRIEVGQTKTNNELATEAAQLQAQAVSDQIAASTPSVSGIMSNSGYPQPSAVFPQGQSDNPFNLNEVGATAQRLAQNTSIDVDWKKGRVQYGSQSGNQNNNILMFGMLGLGALMLLNKK